MSSLGSNAILIGLGRDPDPSLSQFTLGMPPRAPQLIALFNILSERIAGDKLSSNGATESKPIADDHFISTISKLWDQSLDQPYWGLVQGNKTLIYLDFEDEKCFGPLEGDSKWITDERGILYTTPFNEAAFRQKTAKLEAHQLYRTLWNLGKAYPTTSTPDSEASEAFRLLEWPDFGQLDHKDYHLRLAAALTQSPKTIDDLTELTSLSPKAIQQFLNACRAIGLIEESIAVRGDRVAQRAKPLGGLISRLRMKFGL